MSQTSAVPGVDRSQALHQGLRQYLPELFQFDPRICSGWLSDRYFVRTANTLRHAGRDPVVTMQVFAKKRGVLAGVYEAVRLLQTQLTSGSDHRRLQVDTLLEGDAINAGGSSFHMKTLKPELRFVFNMQAQPWGGSASNPKFIETYDEDDTRLGDTWLMGPQFDSEGRGYEFVQHVPDSLGRIPSIDPDAFVDVVGRDPDRLRHPFR